MLSYVLPLQSIDDAASLRLLRTLESSAAERLQPLIDEALAGARAQADPVVEARTHIVLARAALGRGHWVDATTHGQMAIGIAMHLEDRALLQGALAHGVDAWLLLDEPDLALDLLEECEDLLQRDDLSLRHAGNAVVDVVESWVWLAQSRSIDATADAPAQRSALTRARHAAERAGEAALASAGDRLLALCALEALVDALLEDGDAAAARAWQRRLTPKSEALMADTGLQQLAWTLGAARLDLQEGVDAQSVLDRLLPLQAMLPPARQHTSHEATLMLCLSEAYERCGNFEQALQCRKRWADACDRLAATRATEQSKLTQRTLDHLRSQAHEFITRALPAPLSAALLHLREARGAITDEAVAAKVDRVERSTRRALELADTYLNVLSAEYAGQQTLQPLDAGQLAHEVCERAQPRPASDVTIERCIDAGVRVLGDANLLGRALDNLVSNALRHAPNGSTVRVEVKRQDGSACLSVSDSGPGLPMSMRTRLFQRYATDRNDGGNGLGLALVARVARQHQARVQVTTQTGEGTTIALLMKAEAGDPGSAAPAATP